MCKVISLSDRLETWREIFSKEHISVSISSNGKFRFLNRKSSLELSFVDSVLFLKELSEAMEKTMNSLYSED